MGSQLREQPRTSFMWIISTSSLGFISSDEWTSFVPLKIFSEFEDDLIDLTTYFAVPRVFWTPLCRNSNGFFGSENVHDADGNIRRHSNVALD